MWARKPFTPITFLALGICVGPTLATPQTPQFKFLAKPGPYPVGLKIVYQYDRSRPYPSAEARPLKTLVWYPASKSSQSTTKPMTVGDYVQFADTEIHFNAPDEKQNEWRSLLKTSFDIPLSAVRGATPAEGRYSVLIYAPSHSSASWENADLCEYFASHGYVVLASPSLGVSTRDIQHDLDGINAQARDISFLITYAKSLPDTDSSEVAVLSWSWGGISGLFAAARDPRIDALVEMDGSIRYYPGLVKKAGDVHPERMTIPLLFFTQNATIEELDEDEDAPSANEIGPNVHNKWKHGDLLTVNMLGMSHPQFSSMFQRMETMKTPRGFAESQVADYGREDVNTSYAWVALYTLNFLDAYLKHDAVAKAFLKETPAENGVPKHIMGTNFRPAEKSSTSTTK